MRLGVLEIVSKASYIGVVSDLPEYTLKASDVRPLGGRYDS